MALNDIQIPKQFIPVHGSEGFHVRGITFEDLIFLIDNSKPELEALALMMGQSINKDAEQSDRTASATLAAMTTINPRLAALIIACASGAAGEEVDRRSIEIARQLPLPVQTEALVSVAKLTFEVSGGIKKFVELVYGTLVLIDQMAKGGDLGNTGTTG